ncbi:L-lactate permease [Novosphingobium pentaromativorans]|uniref:L-lactate permease n=1 Tax=Novosphingobium pentaromativorans US6-1 TaxID=1088721 RepID=G6E6X1_9SPHN|nr:L-lactate permease [Novosphingobium pentaromativorans]AIT78389.1 lactate permease [Novosphingobium pentaromativorans US6-1]EHJ63017.1 L-lactate permease [Novosphingobium pentaromativorans US6-1]
MAPWLALLPILLLLLSMVVIGWSAARSGVVGAAAATTLAIFAFDYGTDGVSLIGPVLEAGFTTATILWIVFPALALHEVQTRSGASKRIGTWLTSVSDKPAILVLILAWFFALLLEGAAGFGTPVALVAPMLVALGFSPRRSLVLALIGHAAGVSFGAVGTPILPLVEVLPVDTRDLSFTIMLLHAMLGWTLASMVFRLAVSEWRTGNWVLVPLAAFLFLLPALGLAWLSGPELPTLGGALIGGAVFIAIVKWRHPASQPEINRTGEGVILAVLPYALVLVAILATRMAPPLTSAMKAFVLEWDVAGRFGGSAMPLYHPGTLLLLALAGSVIVRPDSRTVVSPSVAAAARRLPSVAIALVSVLALSRIMVHSGMIDTLASAAAALLGPAWPVAVPMVGALGSFITGSATASNILFGKFQVAAAEASGLAPLLGLAGQGFGAAIGNVIAPHNIVAGAATVGLVGREGAILKTTLPVCMAYAAVGGLLLMAMAVVP